MPVHVNSIKWHHIFVSKKKKMALHGQLKPGKLGSISLPCINLERIIVLEKNAGTGTSFQDLIFSESQRDSAKSRSPRTREHQITGSREKPEWIEGAGIPSQPSQWPPSCLAWSFLEGARRFSSPDAERERRRTSREEER